MRAPALTRVQLFARAGMLLRPREGGRTHTRIHTHTSVDQGVIPNGLCGLMRFHYLSFLDVEESKMKEREKKKIGFERKDRGELSMTLNLSIQWCNTVVN